MDRTIVGIDIGSSKICTLVGEVGEDITLRVVGVGVVPSRGIKKGVVVNVADATDAIAASVERAEHTSGYHIERAYISLSGPHVSSLNSRGVVGVSRREEGIVMEDVERALDAARAIAVPHNQEVVHVIPRGYVIDGQAGVRDPIGMHGYRLEVEAHIVTASSSALQNMLQCVEGAAVVADEVVLSSIASGDAVLGETERDMGVVVADIGGGTTDIAIFIDGAVWHTVTLGVGGEYVTNDIAVGLRLPPQVAEQVKLKHGHARASAVSPDERFEVRLPGDGGRQALPRWKLAEIIEARIEELLLMIQQEIKRSGYDGLLPGGVILCGGTAQLPGLTDVAGELFVLPVRVGQPMEFSGLVDTISNPAHATGVGLMSWGMTVDSRPQWHEPEPKPGKRFANWLRAFLPG